MIDIMNLDVQIQVPAESVANAELLYSRQTAFHHRGHTSQPPHTHIFHPDFAQSPHSTNDLCLETQNIMEAYFPALFSIFSLAETIGLIPSKFTACPV